jgi:single-stranded DNA-specific DHH superfamily exonuclease
MTMVFAYYRFGWYKIHRSCGYTPKAKNIDFIICDHHRPGEFLPDAVAILDPKRDDCPYLMMNCVAVESVLN